MSLLEHEKGRISKPTPITAHYRKHKILHPRFSISDQHGNQGRKFRVVDDMAKYLANLTANAMETYFLMTWALLWS